MNEELELILKYPLINKYLIKNKIVYSGFININGKNLNVIIEEQPLEGEYNEYKLKINEEKPNLDIETKWKSVVYFLDNLQQKLEAINKFPENKTALYRKILHHFVEFKRFYELNIKEASLSSDLSKIFVSTWDLNGRLHNIEITVKMDEVTGKAIDLPDDVQWCDKSSNIIDLFKNFRLILDNLQEFFNIMDCLDKNCFILDPLKPKRQDKHRRIWLDKCLSVILTINPLKPRYLPDIKFLGPEKQVNELRGKLTKNYEFWDCSNEFFHSILSLFEMEHFPEKPQNYDVQGDTETLINDGECCICFSQYFNEKLPEVVCNNTSCYQCFHTDCLYEWLKSVTSKRVFNRIFGKCPMCEQVISCELPN